MTEYEEAVLRGDEMRRTHPHAIAASFDARLRKVIVELSSGIGIFFSPEDAQGLEHAAAEDLEPIEISPSGFGLHFPKLDADLYLPGILEGRMGSQKWMDRRAAGNGASSTVRIAG